jgi:hypothetical protein
MIDDDHRDMPRSYGVAEKRVRPERERSDLNSVLTQDNGAAQVIHGTDRIVSVG